jgi:hypothetical protein
MMGFEILERALSIVIVGDDKKLIRTTVASNLTHYPRRGPSKKPPPYGKTNVDKPAAFICTVGTCRPPM